VWVTVSGSVGGHPHWSQKYGGLSWIYSGHWLVQFKVCIVTTVDCMTTAK
jgi:hypothetical protein